MSRDGVVEVKYNQNMFFYENTDYCNDKHDKKKFLTKFIIKILIFLFSTYPLVMSYQYML